MALEMRQRLVIGEASEMLGVTNPASESMIFPYVRSVRTDEDRTQPISTLSAVIPPYPADKMARIKPGMVLRWEAGYWEDGVTPLYRLNGGYHTEFEGVISGVGGKGSYQMLYEDDQRMWWGGGSDALSISIEARDYFYILNKTPMATLATGDIATVVSTILSAEGNQTKFGLLYGNYFQIANIHRSGKSLSLQCETAGQCLSSLIAKDPEAVLDFNGQTGINAYFKGKELVLRDPNDATFLTSPYPIFVLGDNVIESSLEPRVVKSMQVTARWRDPDTEVLMMGVAVSMAPGSADGTSPEPKIVDVEGDISGGQPDLQKKAQDILTRMAGDGFTGQFSAFGYPPVHRGDVIVYIGDDADLQKAVLVDRVSKSYDAEYARFRQDISPGFTPYTIKNPIAGQRKDVSRIQGEPLKEERKAEVKSQVDLILQAIKSGGGK